MILLEEETLQRPKLPIDLPPANVVILGSSERPHSPNPTLPDYDASQAQHPPHQKRGFYQRLWQSRVGKLISYALAIYSVVFIVIGIPAFVLRWSSSHGFKWHGDDSFEDYPRPPPPTMDRQIDLSVQIFGNVSSSCNTWIEPGALQGRPNTTTSMHLTFPRGKAIIMRTNSSLNSLKDYVSGSLRVDMNPDKNVSGVVLVASTRYSSFQLLNASSICLKSFRNTTEVMIHIPDGGESHTDTIDMNLQLFLPWRPAHVDLNMFATHLPMFNQSFGDLGPHIAFRKFEVAGSDSAVTVDSVRATSIVVQTSGAEISGNFSASDNIILDTINGAIYANVFLINNRQSKKPTKLTLETGNGPIDAQVKLQVDEHRYFNMPKRLNFMTMFKTFNAPMNVSIAHIDGTGPARLGVKAENTQGPIAVTLDSAYSGTFELRTKAATTLVQETPATLNATDSSLDGEQELHFDHISSEWTRGWIGNDQRPEDHHHDGNRVQLVNSLSPIELHLARLRPSTAVRR
jgi:hypothetical protein